MVITKQEWIRGLLDDFGKVDGLEQPDGSTHNARGTAEYYWELATKSNASTNEVSAPNSNRN